MVGFSLFWRLFISAPDTARKSRPDKLLSALAKADSIWEHSERHSESCFSFAAMQTDCRKIWLFREPPAANWDSGPFEPEPEKPVKYRPIKSPNAVRGFSSVFGSYPYFLIYVFWKFEVPLVKQTAFFIITGWKEWPALPAAYRSANRKTKPRDCRRNCSVSTRCSYSKDKTRL